MTLCKHCCGSNTHKEKGKGVCRHEAHVIEHTLRGSGEGISGAGFRNRRAEHAGRVWVYVGQMWAHSRRHEGLHCRGGVWVSA